MMIYVPAGQSWEGKGEKAVSLFAFALTKFEENQINECPFLCFLASTAVDLLRLLGLCVCREEPGGVCSRKPEKNVDEPAGLYRFRSRTKRGCHVLQPPSPEGSPRMSCKNHLLHKDTVWVCLWFQLR